MLTAYQVIVGDSDPAVALIPGIDPEKVYSAIIQYDFTGNFFLGGSDVATNSAFRVEGSGYGRLPIENIHDQIYAYTAGNGDIALNLLVWTV